MHDLHSAYLPILGIKAGRQCRYGSWEVPIDESQQTTRRPAEHNPVVPLTSSINEKAVSQIHVLSDFLAGYYPKVALAAPGPIHSPAMSLMHFMISSDVAAPMINSAVDTLCLAHLAAKVEDDRIVHASQDSYGRLLSLLQRAISHSKSEQPLCHHREIVATILALSLMPVTTTKETTKREHQHSIHLLGAAQYLGAHGPAVFDQRRPIDILLLRNIHLQTYFEGVVRRKAILWDQTEWRKLDQYFANTTIPPRVRNDFMVPLPGLLERADRITSELDPASRGRPARREVESLIHRFNNIASTVMPWFDDAWPRDRSEISPIETNSFDLDIEEHCFMSSCQTFAMFYDYAHPEKGFTIANMRLLCLVADCTLLQVIYYGHARGFASQTQIQDVERRAYSHAEELCRHAYFYSKRSISAAHFLCVLLRSARNFFESSGALKAMGWCQACLIATEMRMERLGPTSPPTLCRVGDVLAELPEACRY